MIILFYRKLVILIEKGRKFYVHFDKNSLAKNDNLFRKIDFL